MAPKVAVTVVALLTVTVHMLIPVHAPDQPANEKPVAGVAVSVTLLPLLKFPLQVWPQLIPDGLLVTVPVPAPAKATVNCTCCTDGGWGAGAGGGFPVAPEHPHENKIPNAIAVPANHFAGGNIAIASSSGRHFDGQTLPMVGSWSPALHGIWTINPEVSSG